MSKIMLATGLAEYLNETLGVNVVTHSWAKADRLPSLLTSRYKFVHATLCDQLILFVIDEAEVGESPARIGKHLALIRPKCDWPVVYVRRSVTPYDRKRLIQQRIPFVVPGKQMYLPDLGIDLREVYRKQAVHRQRFRPSAQAVFVHLLLRERDGPIVATQLAKEVGYSAMTLSRVFDEIESASLATTRVVGRERYLDLAGPRRELWAKAQGHLISPVGARAHVRHVCDGVSGPKAGLSALAFYSMIADPPNPTIAVSRESWDSLRQQGSVTVVPREESDTHEVEVWRYAPRPYRGAGVVDPLSLSLSLRGLDDERVEKSVASMLEALHW